MDVSACILEPFHIQTKQLGHLPPTLARMKIWKITHPVFLNQVRVEKQWRRESTPIVIQLRFGTPRAKEARVRANAGMYRHARIIVSPPLSPFTLLVTQEKMKLLKRIFAGHIGQQGRLQSGPLVKFFADSMLRFIEGKNHEDDFGGQFISPLWCVRVFGVGHLGM